MVAGDAKHANNGLNLISFGTIHRAEKCRLVEPRRGPICQTLPGNDCADAGVSPDKLADAREQAERKIARRIANHPIPGKVRRFLTDYWVGLLVREHVKHGALSAEYLNALATVDTLLWSLEPKPEAQDRDRLVQALPELLRTLDQGVERIGMPPEERNELAACHADVVCGMASGPRAAEQPPAQGMVEGDTPDTRQALEVQTLLERAIKRANVHTYKTAQNQPGCKGMGSTVATAFFPMVMWSLATRANVAPTCFATKSCNC